MGEKLLRLLKARNDYESARFKRDYVPQALEDTPATLTEAEARYKAQLEETIRALTLELERLKEV